jgi:polyisoprenoid-binding protein YceI
MLLRRFILLLLPLLPAQAVAEQVELEPPSTTVEIRLYGLGLIPLDGKYARLHGWLTYDPTDRAQCQVELTIDARSLAMADASIRDQVVGPDFMDTERFPTLAYSGTCQGDSVQGNLAMHGVTHPFELMPEWQPGEVTATGRLQRAQWGMTERRLLGGSTVRIRVTVALPGRVNPGSPR